MRHIDAFCHFFPPRLFEKMSRTAGGTKDIGKRIQGVRTIYDLDARLKMMDEFDDYAEILSLGLPPLEAMAGPDEAAVANLSSTSTPPFRASSTCASIFATSSSSSA